MAGVGRCTASLPCRGNNPGAWQQFNPASALLKSALLGRAVRGLIDQHRPPRMWYLAGKGQSK